jgi:hypothetical protein
MDIVGGVQFCRPNCVPHMFLNLLLRTRNPLQAHGKYAVFLDTTDGKFKLERLQIKTI